jgi:hypothetical protein
MNVFKRSRTLAAGFAAMVAIAGCTGGGASPAASGGGEGSYHLGV